MDDNQHWPDRIWIVGKMEAPTFLSAEPQPLKAIEGGRKANG